MVIITKVLDVAGIQNGIEKTLKSLKNKQKEIDAIETAVQGILALEDAFKGKSADAMRNYYREVHLPFISHYKTFIEDYESKLTIMGNELQALESASNGRIVEAFLAEDLQSSLQNTANHTIILTDETNQTIQSVQDIVAAPLLHDTFFLEEVDDAKKQARDTVEKIHQFDYNQSKALEELSNDVSKMQNYINRIQSHTKSGKIQLDKYTIGTVKKYQIDELLLENTCSREDSKEELQKKLANTTNLEEFLKLAKELGEENLTDEQKRILTLWETAEGIKNGAYKAGKEFLNGLFDFVLHPVKNIESTIDALAHPIETLDYFSKAIRDSYERDVINGDAKSRAEWFSYALGSVGLSVLGTKGLGAVSKTGMATTKVVTKAGASKVKGAISGFELLPYAPRNQLAYANASVVPYNVVNGARVKDQLLSMAKVESKSGGKPLQKHHYATNKSKTYTHQLENVTKKYGLELDDTWNKELLPHQGRHPNAYHEYVLDRINEYDAIARGNKEIFLELFEGLKSEVRENPDMLYKEYWLKKK
ncbi:T7SS effector LXG polymorphic toxin [uncultured Rummeliibacillus sp.]|uniref:T7SS effector LXG polymorphic toxin n=1 Tax=uncultured Rummeliibacillus sp. TaxID=762292 RepID=UPI00262A6D3E|nr:T7SS effector LXG polymorphic toxin [uncultured Rummeliibacillus sp.]